MIHPQKWVIWCELLIPSGDPTAGPAWEVSVAITKDATGKVLY